jgi:SSS family solute:Na+ symporter
VLLGVTIVVYVAVMFAISFWVQGRIQSTEDFIVAGRRLPLSLSWATLLATWFGAGTLLTATDEVRTQGLQRAALDPFGAGLCLVVAGIFFARPLWRMGLLTLPDFFGRRFGSRAELLAAMLMVPSYFGWIAAQFVALAGMLALFFGIPGWLGILLVAVVGTGYTLIGGMWSVTLTDAIQICLVIGGLLVLGYFVFSDLGHGSVAAGVGRLVSETPAEMLRPVPVDGLGPFTGWLGVLCVGALGNIPGQDLMQRVFAARSERIARQACIIAGVLYLTVGSIPLALGLAANLIAPGTNTSILPFLARLFLHPALTVIFVLALMSAVLSTVDSAILSPASVLAQNVLARLPRQRLPSLALNRVSVLLVAAASLVVAYLGESAYSLLERAYEVPLVSLFVPLACGLYGKTGNQRAALASMLAGALLWLLHLVLGFQSFLEPLTGPVVLPVSLCSTLCGLIVYLAMGAMQRRPLAPNG